MCKKTIYVTCFILVLVSAGIVSAEMVAQYNFNSSSATTVKDVTGKGHDGTIFGNITFGPGRFGNCIIDNGTGYIALAPATNTDIQFGGRNCTVTAWIKTSSTQAMMIWTKTNPSGNGTHEAQDRLLGVNYVAGVFTADNGWVGSTSGTIQVTDGQWHHVAWTQTQTAAGATATWTLYVDGEVDVTGNQSPGADPTTHQMFIGRGLASSFFPNTWNGSLDDIRIYDNALTQVEIQAVMMEGDGEAGKASEPNPEDKLTDVLRDVTLSWASGEFADTHDVYFGEDFADVNEADSSSPLLVGPGLSDSTYSPGRLDFNQTYYWRVDEVNAPRGAASRFPPAIPT